MVRRRHRRPATSPTRSAASSRTAGCAPGWCGSRRTTRQPARPRPRPSSGERRAGPAWRVAASTPGAWGNQLSVNVREINRVQVISGGRPGRALDTVPASAAWPAPSMSGCARAESRPYGRLSRTWTRRPSGSSGCTRTGSGCRTTRRSPASTSTPPLCSRASSTASSSARPTGSSALRPALPRSRRATATVPACSAGVSAPVDPVTRAAAWRRRSLRRCRGAARGPPTCAVLPLDPDHEAAARRRTVGSRPARAPGLLRRTDRPRRRPGRGGRPSGGAARARGRRGDRLARSPGHADPAWPDQSARPATGLRPRSLPGPAGRADGRLPLGPDTDEPPIFTDEQVFQVQSRIVQQCERLRYRFALLDPPFGSATDAATGLRAVLDWRSRFDTTFAALNYPWLQRPRPALPGGRRAASRAAERARRRRVRRHRPPGRRPPRRRRTASAAGCWRRALRSTTRGTASSTTPGSTRSAPVGGRGLRVLGARTACSDPDWRFVNVRRLMAMVEKALEVALQWAMFEPNGVLHTGSRDDVGDDLPARPARGRHARWCDSGGVLLRQVRRRTTTRPASSDLGRLIVEAGVAPAVPFEFVVLRVGQVRDSLQVREQGTGTGTGGLR